MVTAEILEEKYGMSESELSELDESAKSYETGEWPEGKIIKAGRPPLFEDEVMERVTIRVRRSSLQRIDAAAKAAGQPRSGFIRIAADERFEALASN